MKCFFFLLCVYKNRPTAIIADPQELLYAGQLFVRGMYAKRKKNRCGDVCPKKEGKEASRRTYSLARGNEGLVFKMPNLKRMGKNETEIFSF